MCRQSRRLLPKDCTVKRCVAADTPKGARFPFSFEVAAGVRFAQRGQDCHRDTQGRRAANRSTSARFQRFIDVQLQMLAQGTSAEVSFLHAALALSAPREGMFAIRGGASALANRLAESITRSGGRIRLDMPVLRLSYDSTGAARGVDLLSGETVTASRGVVSNLTVWDTYGKLIGLNRTPTGIRKQLNGLRSWGAYLLYLGIDEGVAASLATPS